MVFTKSLSETHTPTLDRHQHHHKHIMSHSPNSFSILFLFVVCRTFTRISIARGCTSGIYILLLTSYASKVLHVSTTRVLCACMPRQMCTFVCVRFHNLTRDYMGLTELMSKSMGSALGLTGGRLERERRDGPEEGKT